MAGELFLLAADGDVRELASGEDVAHVLQALPGTGLLIITSHAAWSAADKAQPSSCDSDLTSDGEGVIGNQIWRVPELGVGDYLT